jgi:quercetin dioxygenase-like cupin family protein
MATNEDLVVPDGFSWRHALVDPIFEHDGFRHVVIGTNPRDDGKVARSPLVRGNLLSVYVQTCLDGQGENFVHVHSDEATWLVLEGEANFFDGEGGEVAVVRGGEALAILPGTSYRYQCRGERTVMVRVAARASEA